jgi:phage baseplate assembly protein gpV
MAVAMIGVLSQVTAARACNLVVDPNERRVLSGGIFVTDCVDVAATGTLVIDPNTALALNSNGGNNQSPINGAIQLTDSSSALGIIINDHEFTGSGTITGLDPGAKIVIGVGAAAITLTSEVDIEGTLQILNGTFINNGTVEANADTEGYWLEIYPDVLGGSGDWKVTTSAYAELWFRTGSTLLTGNFTVSNGTLNIDENIETTADLTFSGGQIEVAANRRFVANK